MDRSTINSNRAVDDGATVNDGATVDDGAAAADDNNGIRFFDRGDHCSHDHEGRDSSNNCIFHIDSP